MAPIAEPVDLLLANLPYIPSAAVADTPQRRRVSSRHLPSTAARTALSVIRRLIEQLPVVLNAGGVSFLEIGADQADSAREAAAALGDELAHSIYTTT